MRLSPEDRPAFSNQYEEIDYYENEHKISEKTLNETLDMATKKWDTLYEQIVTMAEKHKDSIAFRRSQIGRRWFQPTSIDAMEKHE